MHAAPDVHGPLRRVARSTMRSYRVRLLGPGASAALSPGVAGRVLAVYRRSFYVQTDAGALACLGPAGLGAGPLNALCALPAGLDWQADNLTEGMPVQAAANTLEVGARWRFVLAGARHWAPEPLPAPDPGSLARGLAALAGLCRDAVPARGCGRLISMLAGRGSRPVPDDGLEGQVLTRVAAASGALTRWLAAREAAAPGAEPIPPAPAELAALLGLGPGLTPAGDDFLGGVLIALHHLGALPAARQVADAVLPLAKDRTGRISAAHLAWAARGLGAGALHDLLRVLAAGGDPCALEPALRALDAIGHTSGWDALAGAVTVFAAHAGADPAHAITA